MKGFKKVFYCGRLSAVELDNVVARRGDVEPVTLPEELADEMLARKFKGSAEWTLATEKEKKSRLAAKKAAEEKTAIAVKKKAASAANTSGESETVVEKGASE